MTAVYFKTSEAQENDAISAQAYVRKETGMLPDVVTPPKNRKSKGFFPEKQKMSADVIS